LWAEKVRGGALGRSPALRGALGFCVSAIREKNRCYCARVPVNSTHPDYDANAADWSRARDVLAGEDAVKAGGEKYLPRLDSQTDEEFLSYKQRAAFFNASARSAEGFVGLIFRRPPFVKVPESGSGVGRALAGFLNDADMLGTTLASYAKAVVSEVVGVGRAGSLVDWEGDIEKRAYASLYAAEQIINWRVERVNGRNVPTLIVLSENVTAEDGDAFELALQPQIRVLKLVPSQAANDSSGKRPFHYQVEIWRPKENKQKRTKVEWGLVETKTPLRLGKPLPLIPFVFHGPTHSRSDVDRPPLRDIITVNLDHYRLNADYKHGLHFTALPTAWVSGFDKGATLRIGSSTAWVSETAGATAGFLEFTGQGLTTFERAMDRDERLMAVLGSRLLADEKKVGETAEAIQLRQSGENSALSAIATSVSESLTQAVRWVFWWNSTEEIPDAITTADVLIQLNTDFSLKGMSSQDLQAVVAAWQAGAISKDSMFELFRRGEILPDGRTNEDEAALIKAAGAVNQPKDNQTQV
jgi:hypothetical protein